MSVDLPELDRLRQKAMRESEKLRSLEEAEKAEGLAKYYREELGRCENAMSTGNRTRWDCQQDNELAESLRNARDFQEQRARELRERGQ